MSPTIKRFVVAVDEKDGIVWGIGCNKTEAHADARRWLAEYRPGENEVVITINDLVYHTVSEKQANAVKAGNVSWPIEKP